MRSSEFKLLLMPYSSRLYRMAFGLLGNREESEDAIQDVYLKLWKMRDDLRQYNSLEALAVRVTRNHCLDILRKRKLTRTMEVEKEAEMETTDQKDPSEELIKSERSGLVNELINRLGEPQRSLVYFRHIEEKEYSEIAEIMDMSENSIRVSISRARKQLKEMMQKQHSLWTS